MKKLSTILIALLLLVSVEGQILRYSNYTAPAEPGGVENLLNNGTFDSGDYWFISNAASITGGVASITENVSLSLLYQTGENMISDLEPSTDYTISFDIVSSAPGIWFRILNGNGVYTFVEGGYYTTDHYDLDFTTASDLTVGGIRFLIYTDESNAGTIDNIVLVER